MHVRNRPPKMAPPRIIYAACHNAHNARQRDKTSGERDATAERAGERVGWPFITQPASQPTVTKTKVKLKVKERGPRPRGVASSRGWTFFSKLHKKKINLSPIDINRGIERGREFPFSCRASTDSFSFCLLVSAYARIAYWCVFDSFFCVCGSIKK